SELSNRPSSLKSPSTASKKVTATPAATPYGFRASCAFDRIKPHRISIRWKPSRRSTTGILATKTDSVSSDRRLADCRGHHGLFARIGQAEYEIRSSGTRDVERRGIR